MYNAQKPDPADLPSTGRLLRSTGLAIITAAVILVTIVLPAEYGIDPTRIGSVLGLTEMGEIKEDLAREAEEDRQSDASGERSPFVGKIFAMLIGTAHAQGAADTPWKDKITFTLKPGEGIEWKLVMNDGDIAAYRWEAQDGRVNFDLHGDGNGRSVSYEKGRGSTGEEGELKAAFKGNHGWFWRNRDRQDVTVKLQLRGDYSELKRSY